MDMKNLYLFFFIFEILVIHKFDGGDDGALRLRILFGSGEIIRGGSRIQDCESADQGVDS